MIKIDIEKISRDTAPLLSETFVQNLPTAAAEVIENDQITSQVFAMLEEDPILLLSIVSSKKALRVLRFICAWWWEMGRAYGKAELQPQLDSQVDKILGT